ncbi:outer membrane beta-barrel protein [Chitinophaga nivalis]|uniref:TonB-dependent receptor n=1 Tax=Chitinophaga nivalis TaxID=2991709 RepID=A0ABT3IPN3_9BACT|nr:outer membrane beta-barrel protein [Chitinophaga nivalis]MCW3464401.1 TonB-dependent receptor [Chitinophaga nivalis]MCW3485908.1 TonB-dependent receptor [Chitinophaga nivalis]
MKKVLAFIICITITHCCYAQQAAIKGSVLDTLNHVKLSQTVVALLYAKDSTLYKFTRTNENGQFELNGLTGGRYLLMVTYPAFADYVEPLQLTDTSVLHFNKIMLTLKSRLLQEVVIQQKVAAIKIKGDTTEFNAASYKTQPNATVEDLLKKLPGIQVNNKGQITAQGEKVKKILVDGEEFFGDDPTLTTRNLRADMIDKVQLYDKKSDQAAFTGIDDGEKSKTINLQLREDKKKGYFGKIEAGAGTGGFYDNQAMVNLFRKKQKMAVYGIVSNTGKTGLNWDEREKFGLGNVGGSGFTEDGGIEIGGQIDDQEGWDGQYISEGYPLVQTGGLFYSKKWNQDKNNFTGSYKTLKMYVDGSNNSTTQYILPDTVYYNNVSRQFNNSILRNRASGNYEVQIDSSSSIKLMVDGGLDHKLTNGSYESVFLGGDSALVNSNRRNLSSTADIGSMNSNLLWRKKLKKKGRTISLNLAENYSRNNGNGSLYSEAVFYKGGVPDSLQKTDQYKTSNSETVNVNANLTYSEPLSAAASLIFNYGVNISNNHSNRNSFNRNAAGKYDDRDSLYSNDFAFNMLSHRGGISYGYTKKKIRITLGNNVEFTSYRQQDNYRDISRDRSFVNWYPRASMRYAFSQMKSLSFNFNGNTRQPGINQLQPIRTNDDPLNIYVGNPDLKPSFASSFSLSFNNHKVMEGRSLWVSLNYGTTANDFSERSIIDKNGRRTTQSVNVDGNKNARLGLGMNWELGSSALMLGYDLNGSYSRNTNFINDQLNVTQSNNGGLSVSFIANKEKVYDSYLRVNAAYNSSNSSVQKAIQTNFWTGTLEHNLQLFLPVKLILRSDLVYEIRQKTSVFTSNNNVILWNANISKKLGKKEALELELSVNDLLGQNIGFNRSVNANSVTQNTYSTIGRYGLLSLRWNFNKTGGSTSHE